MRWPAPTSVELVPLSERMRLIAVFRIAAVALLLVAWVALPWTRGIALPVLAAAGLAYIALMGGIEFLWRRSGARAGAMFGLFAMADGLFLTWATYGQSGLDSPTRHLILLQIVTVCLLASFKTGLKLVLFDSWILLGAVYLQELGALRSIGGEMVSFGDHDYLTLGSDIALAFLVALVTAGFAAVNERELRRRRYDLEALARFSLDLDVAEQPADVARCLLDAVADTYGYQPSLVVRALDPHQSRIIAVRGLEATGEVLNATELPVVAAAMRSPDCSLIAHRATDDDAVLGRFADGARLVVVPLRGRHGSAAGALIVAQPADSSERVERRITRMLERFASHASLTLENAVLLDEVRELSLTDPLTGVANRRQLDSVLDQQISRVRRGAGTVALLMLDLDRFKQLNDTHGHQVGDEVLRRVARALEEELRAGDVVGRYGGEEFVIVMPGRRAAEVFAAAERIRSAVARLQGPAPVTVSIGVAWAPAHGFSRETLTKAADDALYHAKATGRDRVVVAGDMDAGEAVAS